MGFFVAECYNHVTIYGRFYANIMEATLQQKQDQIKQLLYINEQLESQVHELQQGLKSANETNQLAIESLQQKINWFEEQFKLAQHQKFGKKSEAARAISLTT